MTQSMLVSTLGLLLRLIEWPFRFFADRSRSSTQAVHLEAKAKDLDDYRIQMDQTKSILVFRRDALLPLIERLKTGQDPVGEVDKRIQAFVAQTIELRQHTTHTALALIPVVMKECETVDYHSDDGVRRLDEYRQAIDDAERATSARRQELRKQYPASPLLMGLPEESAG